MRILNSDDYYSEAGGGYRDISVNRQEYNNSVDRLVCVNAPSNVKEWLDIGCGDGLRLRRLADLIQPKNLTALEPSAGMLQQAQIELKARAVLQHQSIESFATTTSRKFDFITALWNVIGHAECPTVFINSAYSLLAEGGIFIFDANNRFNASQYGKVPSFCSIARSLFFGRKFSKYALFLPGSDEVRTSVYISSPCEVSEMIRGLPNSSFNLYYRNYANGKPAGPLGGQMVAIIRKLAW